MVGLVIRPPSSTPAPALTPGRSPAPPEVLGAGSITSILGAPDIYFRPGPGTLVNITCVVHSLKRPEHIFWYHNGQVSNLQLTLQSYTQISEDTLEQMIAAHDNVCPVTSSVYHSDHVTQRSLLLVRKCNEA